MTPYQKTLAIRQEAKDFIEAFGPRAAQYLAAGLTWGQAVAAHCEFLRLENERLRKQLAQLDLAERVPLSSGGGDIDPAPTKRQGLANKIRGQNL